MNALKRLFERKATFLAVGLVLGIALGLVYGWVISPVQWEDALPSHLRSDLRADFLRMVIDSYSVNKNVDLALNRFEALADYGQEALEAVGKSPEDVSPTAIQNFRAMIEISTQPVATGAPQPTVQPVVPSFSRLLLPVCIGTGVLGALLAVVLVFRGRIGQLLKPGPRAGKVRPGDQGVDLRRAMGPVEPLATFHTVYSIGDDLYDDSFSIESPSGDFLGECGVGLGEIIGVGEPTKVAAFEVWLFDKNDIQTVTKVLMSSHAFNDESTRSRLAAKGDPVLAQTGAIVRLETASLVVEGRIVDMSYGQGPLPPQSFFDRMTIELRAWQQAVESE